jgi:predicted nucleic-acid-binding Zn-ribbon protein
MQKRCPKCGGRMFLQYGTGYKGNLYDYGCLFCGYTENAGNAIPRTKPKRDIKDLFRECR